MRTPSFYDPPMPDFSAINRSISWMTDPMLPALLEKTYQTIITNHDERPFFVAAYDALSEIAGYNKRLNVAYQLKDRLLNYLKSRYVEGEDLNQQNNEFDALIHYLQVLDTACSDSKEINKLYKENADKPIRRLDALVFYLTIKRPDHQDDFLWFSQLHYYYGRKAEQPIEPDLFPLYTYTFKDRIIAYPAINFCISLLEGLTYINNLFSKDEETQLVSVKDFNVNLRNYCFDEYIDIKGEEERRLLLQNNARDEEPTHYDGEVELLRKEVINYEEAEEQHMDTEVLHMAEFFIKRLRKSLGFENPQDEIDPSSKEFNIHNHDAEIDKRIKAVFKAKICTSYADWGVIMRLLVELDEYADVNYTAVANRINTVCGKPVTTASALKTSHAMTDVGGAWKDGWKDKVHTRQSANLLNHFKEIARIFMK